MGAPSRPVPVPLLAHPRRALRPAVRRGGVIRDDPGNWLVLVEPREYVAKG